MLKSFTISGDSFLLGLQLGSLMRSQTAKRLRILKSFAPKNLRPILKTVFQKCEKRHPDFVQELIGYSAGAKVDFWDLFYLNCPEIREARHGCTTVVMPPYVAHNEDGDIGDTKNLCAMVTTERFTAFHYAGELLGNAFSWNERLFIAISQLPDIRIKKDGIPRFFTARALLDAKNISSVRRILQSGNASGYHYVVAEWGSGNIFSFETSLNKVSEQKICSQSSRGLTPPWRGWFGHANHYIHRAFSRLARQKKIPSRSKIRYERVQQLLPNAKSSKDMLKILADKKIFQHNSKMGLTLATCLVHVNSKDIQIF